MASSGGGGWAAVARKDAAVEPKVDIASVLSNVGLKTVVVDANALIGGGVRLPGVADQFFTVKEVLAEVRDPASRFHLDTLPVSIRCLEPSEDALAAVVKFSRMTGDLQSLSDVDLKVIALTYTLEAQAHGTAHIRPRPPPLVVTSSSTRRQRDPPGWGNVENPEEWEGIDEEHSSGASKTQSRILGSKPLNLDLSGNLVALNCGNDAEGGGDLIQDGGVDNPPDEDSRLFSAEDSTTASQDGFGDSPAAGDEQLTSKGGKSWKPRRDEPESSAKKQAVDIDGKVNVAEGVDASKGEAVDDSDDWRRASSRSSRRKYLKRETKRALARQVAETSNAELPYSVGDEVVCDRAEQNGSEEQSSECGILSTEHRSTNEVVGGGDDATCCSRDGSEWSEILGEEEDIRLLEDETENNDDTDDLTSNGDGTSSLHGDGLESEQSWKIRPHWKSSVACMTGDYAMQNVLLQMGLRLLSTTGLHIRELNKWVLKCQACNRVTSDVGRIFCPKCGNGGTLFKVSVTVGENGTLHAGRTRRINLRGTRYSLPMPKGGREGAIQNPILREDQLPSKLLHPRPKKGVDLDNFSGADVIFTVAHDKKSHNLPNVKTAAAIFGGRRNPNERRGARNC